MNLLSFPLYLVTRVRNSCFDHGFFSSVRSRLPIVSVGNVTVGGTGKTPLALLIVELLRTKGYRPVILSRGYGGSERGPVVVDDGADWRSVGDEPLMMHQRSGVPVVVARRRVDGARYIEQHALGNCIILDDGFQHRWLARDLNIVCIDSSSPRAIRRFASGMLLPFGIFRESWSHALSRIDAVVISARSSVLDARTDASAVRSKIPQGIPVFQSRLGAICVKDARGESPAPGSAVVAFCGIANPEGFRNTLEQSGYRVEGWYTFSDHHAFSEAELGQIIEKAQGKPIFCTEKDSVKVPPSLRARLTVVSVTAEIEPADAFEALVLQAIENR